MCSGFFFGVLILSKGFLPSFCVFFLACSTAPLAVSAKRLADMANVFDRLANAQKQTSTNNLLEKVTSTTDFDELSMMDKLSIFEQCSTYCASVSCKFKNECKLIIPQMLSTIKSLQRDLENEKIKVREANTKLKELEDKSAIFPTLSNRNESVQQYGSYANCLSNRKEENIIIFKPLTDNLDLRKETFERLKKLQDKVDVKKIKVNKKDTLVIDVMNKDQQEIIVKELKDDLNLKAVTPKSHIPSILIKDIERDSDIKNYEEYILEQLAANNEIDKKKIVIKKVIDNSRFRSIRCIVNFDQQTTSNLVRQGSVKIGFKICVLERVVNLRQCFNCCKFGHFAKDHQGNETCKNQRACSFCASNEHDQSTCPAKENVNKHKCANCKGNHHSFHRSCESRKEKERYLLSKCL